MVEEFEDIMLHAPKIQQMKKLNIEEYLAFSNKKGEQVRLVSAKKHLEWLPRVEYLYPFYQKYEISWLIPCVSPSLVPYGYVIRAFNSKEYRVCLNKGSMQLLYGWELFDNEFNRNKPIILTEGIKDAIYLQRFHPYCLAFLSSDISNNVLNLIIELTSKVILATDNDTAGYKHRNRLRKAFTEKRVQVADLVPVTKDFGEYFKNINYYDSKFLIDYKMALMKLGVNL